MNMLELKVNEDKCVRRSKRGYACVWVNVWYFLQNMQAALDRGKSCMRD